MKQQPLLTIRQQPSQKPAEIPSRTIRAYVRENLRDFGRRQSEREKTRKEKQEKYNAEQKPKGPKPTMRTIRVTFRAEFEQPIGVLNPMGLKLPGRHPVELFKAGPNWTAREIASARRQVYDRIGKFASLDDAKQRVQMCFKKMVEPWQIWGIPPQSPAEFANTPARERMLSPDEICSLGGDVFGWYTAEDQTHIIHAPVMVASVRETTAACGRRLAVKHFISNLANIRPTCRECAEIWEREYKGR